MSADSRSSEQNFEILAVPAPGNPFHFALPVHSMVEGEYNDEPDKIQHQELTNTIILFCLQLARFAFIHAALRSKGDSNFPSHVLTVLWRGFGAEGRQTVRR